MLNSNVLRIKDEENEDTPNDESTIVRNNLVPTPALVGQKRKLESKDRDDKEFSGITTAYKRLMLEFKHSNQDDEIQLKLIDDKWDHLEASFYGPLGSPYAHGNFKLNIQLYSAFPYYPPKVNFITKIWHPNVDAVDGSMCDNFLRDWSAAMGVVKLCIYIRSLLSNPDKDCPESPCLKQWIQDPSMFEQTAKYWSSKYAGAPTPGYPEFDAKVEKLVLESKSSSDSALTALSLSNWNHENALEILAPKASIDSFSLDTSKTLMSVGIHALEVLVQGIMATLTPSQLPAIPEDLIHRVNGRPESRPESDDGSSIWSLDVDSNETDTESDA